MDTPLKPIFILGRFAVVSNDFTAIEAGNMSSLAVELQRLWRQRGHLPSNGGKRYRFDIGTIAQMALAGRLARLGCGPQEALLVGESYKQNLIDHLFYRGNPSYRFYCVGSHEEEFASQYQERREAYEKEATATGRDLLVSIWDGPFERLSSDELLSESWVTSRIIDLGRLAETIRVSSDRILFNVHITS